MATWYHRATWALLKAFYTPALSRELGVELSGRAALPKQPFLLVSNHSHALDPYVLGAFSPRPIRYMANLAGVHPVKAALAGLIGAYGRRKGTEDLGALQKTIRLAAGGDAIGIFPEGDRSWDGACVPIRAGIGRLARKLGLPLVIARQAGNYLSMPRWAKSPRRGRWSVEFIEYGADEVAAMSDALLEAIVVRALERNDIKDSLREGRYFAGRNVAEGVERLLWRCPACGGADSIVGRGDEIRCDSCGARWGLDANLRVRPLGHLRAGAADGIADLKDWNDWQVASIPSILEGKSGGQAFESMGVVLSEISAGIRRRIGRGRLALRENELRFESPEGSLAFEAAYVRGFIDNFNACCEFGAEGLRWRLEFGGKNASKWAYALALRAARGASGGEGEAA